MQDIKKAENDPQGIGPYSLKPVLPHLKKKKKKSLLM